MRKGTLIKNVSFLLEGEIEKVAICLKESTIVD